MRALRLCGRLVAAAAPANIGIPPAPSPPLFSPPHTDTFPLLLLDNEICNKARISLQQKPGAATSTHPITHLSSQPHPLLTLSPYCETISLFLFDDEICRGHCPLTEFNSIKLYFFQISSLPGKELFDNEFCTMARSPQASSCSECSPHSCQMSEQM